MGMSDNNTGTPPVLPGAGQPNAAGTPPPGTGGTPNPGQTGGSVGGTGTGGSATPAPSTTPSLSRDEIAAIVEGAVKANQPAPTQPTMSPEEMDRALKVFRPTAKHVDALREGGEAAVAAMNEIAHGIYEQAVTMAAYQLQMQMEQLNGQLGPVQQFVQQQQMEMLKNEFFTSYPDLKGLDPILTYVKDEFARAGKRFPDKQSAFTAVATRARELVKTLPGFGSAGAGAGAPAGGGNNGTQTHGMSTQIGGGQGGAAGSGSPGGQNKPAWMALD